MSSSLLAVSRLEVAGYLYTLITLYIVLIVIRVVMSWIPRMPYNRALNAFLGFVQDVTDPYLNIFRRFIPMARVGPAALDLSPIVGLLVLAIVGQGILVRLVAGT